MGDPLADRFAFGSELITEAAALALHHYQRQESLAVRSKGRQDMVSEADRACEDLIVAGSPRTRPLRTWGFPRGIRLLRIDHTLGSGLEAFSNRVVRVRGSDHAMVVVDLEIS